MYDNSDENGCDNDKSVYRLVVIWKKIFFFETLKAIKKKKKQLRPF